MKLLTATEYKKQNPDAYLKDYISYLEEQKREAETVLESAKSLGLDETVLNNIDTRITEITQILNFISTHLGQVIINSIHQLSKEELRSYFDYSKEQKEQEDKKNALMEQIKEREDALAAIIEQMQMNLYQNGRSEEFYVDTDAETFFADTITPEQFYSNLLSGPFAPTLLEDVKTALEIEGKNQEVEIEDIDRLATDFVDLIKESRQILEYSSSAKEQLVKKLMTENGIGRILPPNFKAETPILLAYDLMSLTARRTTFFDILPNTLQETLEKEYFRGPTYQKLLETYLAYKNGEEVKNTDLNNEEEKKKKDLEEELKQLNYELTCLNATITARETFLEDENAMRSVLKEALLKQTEIRVPSLVEINSTIEQEEAEQEELAERLKRAYEEFNQKRELISKARTILMSSDYDSFFRAVENNNTRRIYRAFGVVVTEKVIEPFVKAEQKRLEQIQIMISMIEELEGIERSIHNKKDSSNFLTRQLPSYKEAIQRLETVYHKASESGFEQLKNKQLFYIHAPKISYDSTMENIICIEPKVITIDPQTLEELSGRQQGFWNLSVGIDKNTQRKFMEGYADWGEFSKGIMGKQDDLITKLFNFEKVDGYFRFSITEEERKMLLEIQRTILEIAQSVYEERKAFRLSLGSSQNLLDPTQKQELAEILGPNANLSRENLADYIERTTEEIDALRKLLSQNSSLCTELSLSIPDKTLEESDTYPNVRIKNLNLEGITTLKDAKIYRDLLLGISVYTVSKEDIKTYYLEHQIKVK